MELDHFFDPGILLVFFFYLKNLLLYSVLACMPEEGTNSHYRWL